MLTIRRDIALRDLTTIRLGGPAKYFCSCTTVEELKEAIVYARDHHLRMHLLAGGSNTVFSDAGFDGLIVKMELAGISYRDEGESVIVTAGAGEAWEPFVHNAVAHGYAGVECLSGIPGSVGATPIQNVGAYGQEVKDVIDSVRVLHIPSLQEQVLHRDECRFSYRNSRFKSGDAGTFIITEVTYRLQKNGRPVMKYPEVKTAVEKLIDLASLADGKESLEAVRSVVLSLRKRKSMVIDPEDPNTRSVGSFFMNPVIDAEGHKRIAGVWKRIGDGTEVPVFPQGDQVKIPAAWLIEKSGFVKGFRKNGVGISEHHTLALVNINGTAAALTALAEEIREKVSAVFSVTLEHEANIIS